MRKEAHLTFGVLVGWALLGFGYAIAIGIACAIIGPLFEVNLTIEFVPLFWVLGTIIAARQLKYQNYFRHRKTPPIHSDGNPEVNETNKALQEEEEETNLYIAKVEQELPQSTNPELEDCTEPIPDGYNYKLLHKDQNPLWPGPSREQIERIESITISIPLNDCICGCNGEPMTAFSNWEIYYPAYEYCPARLNRKRAERERSRQRRKAETERRRAERQAIKEEAKQLKLRAKEETDTAQKREWDKNHRSDLPATSKMEAAYRDLRTFHGKPCTKGHEGKRLTRNGQCVLCRKIARSLRNAMRRAQYPETLNEIEREQVLQIYAKAKQLTQSTGIEYHVDHIRPLSKGGRHHPSNLQILTARENLAKGDKWIE